MLKFRIYNPNGYFLESGIRYSGTNQHFGTLLWRDLLPTKKEDQQATTIIRDIKQNIIADLKLSATVRPYFAEIAIF
jgi:hypothetical protein